VTCLAASTTGALIDIRISIKTISNDSYYLI